MLRTFIQVLALCLTLIASFFLLRPNLGLSVQNVAEVSKSKWGYNLDVAKNLVSQAADTKVGLVFLLMAFFLQMGNLVWPMRIQDFGVSKIGIALAVVLSLVVFPVGLYISKAMSTRSTEKVTKILESVR